MKLLKALTAILVAGVASVLAVQLFYKAIYAKWKRLAPGNASKEREVFFE